MENKHVDLIGVKRSFLTVIGVVSGLEGKKKPKKRNFLVCICECGKEIKKTIKDFNKREIMSCGCKTRGGYIDGRKKHQLYFTYKNMISRCYNVNNSFYRNYGERGISVCQDWLDDFNNFIRDVGERPKGLTLDRIDNDGNYCPENVKWSTAKEQANNRSKKYMTNL